MPTPIPPSLTRLHPTRKVEDRLAASSWFWLMRQRHETNPSGLLAHALDIIKQGRPLLVLKDDLAEAKRLFPSPPTFDTTLTALTK